jgi:hypothetical protein
MTTPNEEALKDPKKLKKAARSSGLPAEEIANRLNNPKWDLINDPKNPFRKKK